MTWAKVDDRTHEDPRTEAAGVEAMGLWVLALAYMAAHSTDGRITVERCRRLAGAQKGRRLADRLVAAGWWEGEGEGAYRLVDWERLLLSRAEVEERSARAADVGRLGGKARTARARLAPVEPAKVEASSGARSGDSQPPTTRSCSGALGGKSAESKETPQPTPAHDPDPSRPVSVSAHARVCVQDEGQDEGRGGSPSPVVTPSPPSPIGREGKGLPPASTIPKGGRTCPRCSAATYRDDGDPRCADCQDIEERQAARAKKAPLAGTTPPLPGLEDVAAAPPAPDPVPEVWAAFLAERQRHLGSTAGRLPVLDDKRRASIARALKSYSLADVCAAVRGIWRDGFHREKDWKYATVEVALRDASHIEQFRELGASAPAAPRTVAVPPKRNEPRLPPGPRRSPEELKAVWEMFKHEAGGQEWLGGGA